MYDLSSKFNTFYKNYVILSQADQDELYSKKNLNIESSVAMSTVVQNENDDHDIDVAIVFSKSDLGDKGAQATRNMVANALRYKTKQFKAEPEVKTSCVRIEYTEGYLRDRNYATASIKESVENLVFTWVWHFFSFQL